MLGVWLALAVAGWASAPTQRFDTAVISAQRKLDGLGYLPGNWDGLLGPRTRAALEAFQGDHGLLQTGQLTEETARMLGLRSETAIMAPTHLVKLQEFLRQRKLFSAPVDGQMGKQTWQAMQRYLQQQGHYQGKVDGLAGAQTRAAIKAWQRALPVAATGVLDANTVAALLAPPAEAPAPAPAAP